MSTSTIHDIELRAALAEMTGWVSVVEAAFTPWDPDQLVELDRLLVDLTGLERVDDAIIDDAA
ncbi:hypothetical protein [Mobilicoccus massiliensis]|uniref:hypothetical protein n=1 Tax=Mobilicoccus massiliensis TaxID=1522310 RepID=UPI00059152FD|nr:hypothetical protein [Mobilicoccus massiliensis]